MWIRRKSIRAKLIRMMKLIESRWYYSVRLRLWLWLSPRKFGVIFSVRIVSYKVWITEWFPNWFRALTCSLIPSWCSKEGHTIVLCMRLTHTLHISCWIWFSAFYGLLRANASCLHIKLFNRPFKLTSLWTSYALFFDCDDPRNSQLISLKGFKLQVYFWP